MEKYKYIGSDLGDLGFTRKMTKRSGATHKYEVTRPTNVKWPDTDAALINFCDGGSSNFGGDVFKSETIAYVSVYVD